MSNFTRILLAFAGVVSAAPAAAAILGPHAADCAPGAGRPAMLVRVEGVKGRTGMIRVQSYGGDPAHYFDKGTYLERVEARTPSAGPVEVCLSVPRPGVYAVSARHNANGDGHVDIGSDGGGFSGNPNISLFDVMFKRHPSPVQVQIKVGGGLTLVPIVLNYVHGASVGPLGSAH